ncbi:MAG: hypothetical protein ABRQ38_27920, partial [Candidatus Eremiobacterota bacterium]
MKINSEQKIGQQIASTGHKKTEKKNSDEVIVSGRKTDQFNSMVNKLKKMQEARQAAMGNDFTEEAREIFKRIGSMKGGKEKEEAKEVILKLGKAENEFMEGIENFDLIQGYKPENKPLKKSAHEFSELLTTLGNDMTEEARAIFKRIGSMKDGKEKEEAKEVILKLGKAENEFMEGIENFDLIKGYKPENKTLKKA